MGIAVNFSLVSKFINLASVSLTSLIIQIICGFKNYLIL